MEEVLDFIKQPIVTSIITSSIVTLIVQTLIKEFFANSFRKSFEKYKEQLTIHAENRKLDFDRKLHDFSLYSNRRHEIYPEIYKRIFEINKTLQTYEEKVKLNNQTIKQPEDILVYYDIIGIDLTPETVEKIQKKCDEKWAVDIAICLLQVSRLVKNQLAVELRKYIEDSYNFFSHNMLFLSDNVNTKIDYLFDLFAEEFDKRQANASATQVEAIQIIDEKIIELKESLSSELKRGDYVESVESEKNESLFKKFLNKFKRSY
ncbi:MULTISPECIES: hypothetical protein [Bacillus]|uniref:hypothetical protein n=1 Tax=Bacillus TaxID=1386 RepID=UPI001D007983|nr:MULTISPECIES: hypothetical protein [Bacillus]MCL7871049.1 hypothetical protein [Bacillus altitudinis]UDF15253.1 hypothetical protein LG951_12170 [Bacillus pumilus]